MPEAGRTAALIQRLNSPDREMFAGAALQAYTWTFGVTAAFGLLLGLLAWLAHAQVLIHPAAALLTTLLSLLTLLLSGWGLRWARARAKTAAERRAALLSAVLQGAAAPALPWLLACAGLPQPPIALGLMLLSGLVYALGRQCVRRWAAEA